MRENRAKLREATERPWRGESGGWADRSQGFFDDTHESQGESGKASGYEKGGLDKVFQQKEQKAVR